MGWGSGRGAVIACAVVALFASVALSVSVSRAQDADDEEARLAPDTPLTLRPTERTRALARGVTRTLALRLDVPVAVGDDAPPELLEAVPAGHLGLDREGDVVRLVLAGPEAQVYRSEVRIEGGGADAVRSVALAVEVLRDAALDGPPPGTTRRRTYTLDDGRSVTWTYLEPEGGLFGPRPRLEALATPAISVGVVGTLSTEGGPRFSAGPRLVLGLCLSAVCVGLEGDLPVVPDEGEACDGRIVEYRPVNLGMRVTLRPYDDGEFSAAFLFGLLTRFGVANLVGLDVSRVVSDFGIRSGLEGAWRFAEAFELVFDAGADIHTAPATFRRANRLAGCPPVEDVLVEDLVTVWASLGVRLRPR